MKAPADVVFGIFRPLEVEEAIATSLLIISENIYPFKWMGIYFSLQLFFFLSLSSQQTSTHSSGWVGVISSNFCSS
jgi:hypothetical protein